LSCFTGQTPWYQKKTLVAPEINEFQQKALKANDPIADMEVYLNQMKGIRPKSLREKQLEAVGRALSLLSMCSAVVVVLIDIPF